MEKLRIILLGAGTLACPLLESILAAGRDELLAVVTQPDRAGGRGLQCQACALKTVALARGLPVLTPADASAPDTVAMLAAWQPDVLIVASFGQFLKKNLLAVPRLGTINVHPSLLPKYRGASPIQWALANGDEQTGVSVLYVTPRMDAGDVLAQAPHPIAPEDTFCTLEPKLAALGAQLLQEVLDGFRAGRTQGVPQDEAQVTLARKLTKDDGRVDWTLPAATIRNRLRGFMPWPGAFTVLPGGLLLKLHGVQVEPWAGGTASPGTVLAVDGAGPLVATGRDALRLTHVQPAGKKAMAGAAFLRGHALPPGSRLGQ
ncbi:MAG TPA: methionyl-tRNA formyltransferase [Kiritimatiellia bacterium]|jgi:methionyl-tRNA formyltransferase|nr:methionyl-tRNA formyltransferase [Kiritimatiellia bacterium]HOR75042.1 methionyl-tRNA formyltransferase [Kiritimatiellia bacterium]HPK69985.1 methionyl-tRNA formyltransferase [Kiritimatiellia bacterium]